jgi:hypothetical protein
MKFEEDTQKSMHFRGKVKVLWQTDGRTDRQTDRWIVLVQLDISNVHNESIIYYYSYTPWMI